MRITAWDSVFVRCRRADVHPIVRDLAGYGRWWPGVETRPSGDTVAMTLRPPGFARRPQRFTVKTVQDRSDRGIRMRYTGDVVGDAEWYYLDEPTGVVVHYLVNAEVADRGWRRRLADHRAAVRLALHTLKDRLEGDRVPGAEPDARLLADQRRAIAEVQAAARVRARGPDAGEARR